MSDSVVNLASNYEGETSSVSIMGIFPNSHIHHLDCNIMELEAIPLSDDSDSKMVYGVHKRFKDNSKVQEIVF